MNASQSRGISPRRVLLLGALVPAMILFAAYAWLGMWPFGTRAILEVDAVHQYLPFLTELRRKLVSGEGLFYSFSGGLGYNFWATIAYYTASPLNLLLVLLPGAAVCDFMAWMMLVKLSLSGGILSWYLYRREEDGPWWAVVLGTMYALSNFLLGYKFNVMWLDSIAVAPLVLWGLEELVVRRRSGVYLAALFYAIWCNYYIGYMICLYLCLYLVYLLFTRQRQEPLGRTLLRFCLSSLSAGGMAAVLILPAWLGLKRSPSCVSGAGPGVEWYSDPFALLRFHLVDTEAFRTSYQRGDAQIYCGVILLLLAAIYFVNRKISLRERIGTGVLLGVMVVSFLFSPLNYFWHGLHLETGLPNRFAFLYLILLCTMGHRVLCRLDGISFRGYFCAAALVMAAVLVPVLRDALEHESLWGLLSLGLLALYTALLLCLLRGRTWVASLLCLLLVLEAAGHGWRDFWVDGGDDKTFYVSYRQDMQEMLEETGEEGFFRTDVDSDSMINFATYAGAHGVALFHSGMQAGVQDFFEAMHAYTRLNTVWYKGISKPLRDILGQRYLFTSYVNWESWMGAQRVALRNGRALYRNPDALSVGYLVSKDLLDWDPVNDEGMDAENSFFALACGEENLFQKQDFFLGRSGVSYRLELPENGMLFVLLDTAPQSFHWETPESVRTYEKRTNMIYEAASTAPGQRVVFSADNGGRDYTGTSFVCDGARYRAALARLGESQLEQVQTDGDSLSGIIDAKGDGLLLLTVPFDRGWQVYLDGKKTDSLEIGGVFTAVEMSQGEHQVVMRFTPPGFWAGLGMSLMSFLLGAGVLIWQRGRISEHHHG